MARHSHRTPRRQRILITGASSGLGAELARIWAADGRDLALCARRLPELEVLRDELLAAHPGCSVHIYPLDVTDPDAAGAVVTRAVQDLGGLDRVVANAGIGLGAFVGRGQAAANRQVIETNVIGTLNTIEPAVAHFWSVQAGHLVIISSITALRGTAGPLAAYASSKAAVATLGDAVRSGLWNRPITVSTIFPGYIDTAMNVDDPRKKWSVPLDVGGRALAEAIDAEPSTAYVPRRPWALVGPVLRFAPFSLARKLAG